MVPRRHLEGEVMARFWIKRAGALVLALVMLLGCLGPLGPSAYAEPAEGAEPASVPAEPQPAGEETPADPEPAAEVQPEAKAAQPEESTQPAQPETPARREESAAPEESAGEEETPNVGLQEFFDVSLMASDLCPYYLVLDTAPVREGYYESKPKVGTKYAGDRVKVLESKTNSKGNVWYKIGTKQWIFSGHLRQTSHCASGSATSVWYGTKNNFQHIRYTDVSSSYCTVCGKTLVAGQCQTAAENHDWNNLGVCKVCGYQYQCTITSINNKRYVVTADSAPVHDGPYGACATVRTWPKGTLFTVNGQTTNAYQGNHLWYRTPFGWIYHTYVEPHSSHSYSSDTGLCICGMVKSVPVYDGITGQYEATGYTQVRENPFPKSKVVRDLGKGAVVNVSGYTGIAGNNDWFQCADGYVKIGNMKAHSHNYEGGICSNTGCGAEFPFWRSPNYTSFSGSGKLYETTDSGKAVRVAPYQKRKALYTIDQTGTVIRVIGWCHNGVGDHKWYQLCDTGGWIYEDNVKPHEHHYLKGVCDSPGCGVAAEIKTVRKFSPPNDMFQVIVDDAPARVKPFGDADVKKKCPKDAYITVTRSATNSIGDHVWYHLADGTWIYEDNIKPHTHNYKKKNGVCSDCNYEEPLDMSPVKPTDYTVKQDDTILRRRPYEEGKEVKRLKKGDTVIVIGAVLNQRDKLWYVTSEGYYVFSERVKFKTLLTYSGGENSAATCFTLQVTTSSNSPIAGAAVTFGTQTATTNENGLCTLNRIRDGAALTVSASGYETYSNTGDFGKTGQHKVTLSKVGETEILSAILEKDGINTDVLHNPFTLNQAADTTAFSLQCKVNTPSWNPVTEYRLEQDQQVVAASSSATFSNLRAEQFTKDKSIYLSVKLKNNAVIRKKLQITVTFVTFANNNGGTDYPSLGLKGYGSSITIPVSEPVSLFFKDIVLETPQITLPFVYQVGPDGSYRVGANLNLGNSDASWEAIKELKGSDFAQFYEAHKVKDLDDQGGWGKWKWQIGGYLEGNIHSSAYSGKLFISVSKKYFKEADLPPIPVPPLVIPLCGEFSFSFKGGADVNFYSRDGLSNLHFENVMVPISCDIGLYLGVGVAYVASVGVFGQLTPGLDFALIPELNLDTFYITGAVGIKAKLLGKDIASAKFNFPKYPLYTHDDGWFSVQGGSETQLQLQDALDPETATTMDRSYLETRTGWYPSEAQLMEDTPKAVSQFDFDVLQDSAFTDIRPQVVTTDDVIMMLYVDDAADRGADNRQMLVFSLYNPDTGLWSAPKPVDDDGTGDYFFHAAADGEKIYVVWQNAGSPVPDGASIQDISQLIDLRIASFDPRALAFTHVEDVTGGGNTDYELMPRVAGLEGDTVVAWFTNSQSDVLGQNGTNTVHYAVKNAETYSPALQPIEPGAVQPEDAVSGVDPVGPDVAPADEPEEAPVPWTCTTVQGDAPAITSLSAGYMLDQAFIAYTTDEDGSDLTADDQQVFLVRAGSDRAEAFTDQAMNVEFTKVHGDNAMTWFNQGYIFYTYTDDGELGAPQILCEESDIPYTEYHIISSDAGNMAILYTLRDADKSEATLLLYDENTQTWGLPVSVTQQDSYIMNFNGCYAGETIVTVFNQTSVDLEGDDLREHNRLCSAVVNQRNDIVVENVSFTDIDLEPAQAYPLTLEVRNNGTMRCESLELSVYHHSELLQRETVSEVIRPGETVTLETTITTPDPMERTDYEIVVEQAQGDAAPNNNRFTLALGRSALALTAEQWVMDGENLVHLRVENRGYDPAGGALVLYDSDFNVLEPLLEGFEPLGHGEALDVDVLIDPELFEGELYRAFWLGVETEDEQSVDSFNRIPVGIRRAEEYTEASVALALPEQDAADQDAAALMDAEQTFSGTVANYMESDIQNGLLCVMAYDYQGAYLDSYMETVSLATGEKKLFTASFPAEYEIWQLKAVILDGRTMRPLTETAEILKAEETGAGIEKDEAYYEILPGEEV